MTIRQQMAQVVEALNQRDFAALEVLFDADAVLDMPDGQRVIGSSSIRDTLSAYLLRHDARFANGVAMADDAGLRGAYDGTIDGRDRDGGAGSGKGARFSLPCVLVFENEEDHLTRLSLYLSTAL
ncbi:MAG: nuclear transport factor 2 family protein [Rhizobium sp.]|nr:nuclear transport factor 2 family protein [Rhizobium sp.]